MRPPSIAGTSLVTTVLILSSSATPSSGASHGELCYLPSALYTTHLESGCSSDQEQQRSSLLLRFTTAPGLTESDKKQPKLRDWGAVLQDQCAEQAIFHFCGHPRAPDVLQRLYCVTDLAQCFPFILNYTMAVGQTRGVSPEYLRMTCCFEPICAPLCSRPPEVWYDVADDREAGSANRPSLRKPAPSSDKVDPMFRGFVDFIANVLPWCIDNGWNAPNFWAIENEFLELLRRAQVMPCRLAVARKESEIIYRIVSLHREQMDDCIRNFEIIKRRLIPDQRLCPDEMSAVAKKPPKLVYETTNITSAVPLYR